MKTPALALALLSAVGCSKDSMPVAGGGDAAVTADLSAAPSSDSALPTFGDGPGPADGPGSVDPAAMFVGTWMYVSGTRMLSCPTLGATDTQPLKGNVVVARGIEAPLLAVIDVCSLRLDPQGNTAVLRAGQICPPVTATLSDGTPYTETDTFSAGTISLNGEAGTIALSGSANIVAGGTTIICSFTLFGSILRTGS